MKIGLLPENPAAWPQYRFEDLLAIDKEEREALQLAALQLRFARLKDRVPALRKLAAKQGVERIDRLSDALPVYFDHRVLKNYPISIIENRDFAKLTAWLDKLTMHDLTRVDLSGLKTLDEWLDRLEAYGMIIGTSSGTTGKLSFVARSKDELAAWRAHYREVTRMATGADALPTPMETFFPGYRSGHQMLLKMMTLFNMEAAGGPEHYHTLYDERMPADLMALSGRLQAAEDKGDLHRLGLDPALLEQRERMIAAGKRKDQDMEAWFGKLIETYRGQRVRIGGPFSELYRVAKSGLDKGLKCAFAPGSVLLGGGGLKGYKDAPDDWEDVVKAFFGIGKLGNMYGFSECMGNAALCDAGYFHLFPYAIPTLLGPDANELPRSGVQKGRLAVFDLLAETCWGGFISGDEVTMHWDENCPCGHGGPRIEKTVRRYSEMEGGDDKITCAGSAQAYNEFMDYVMGAQ
jgi:hypothetical protein